MFENFSGSSYCGTWAEFSNRLKLLLRRLQMFIKLLSPCCRCDSIKLSLDKMNRHVNSLRQY